MLDGAGYNAPVYDTGKDKAEYKEIPTMPDRETEPVKYLRWQLENSPAVPAKFRPTPERVEELCLRFQSEIDAGEKVWHPEWKDWVHPSHLNEPAG
jgi:hypothetical protein